MSYKFTPFCLKVILTSCFLLVLQFSHAQVNPESLNAIMEQRAKTLKDNNIVLAVANKDTLIFKNDTKLFNYNRSQAPAGYISQFYTAAVIMMLVDEGKLNLEDKVAQYLPVFAKYGKNYITIRNCLTHNTGIQLPKMKANEKSKASLEDEVNSYAAKEIQTNPGTEFRYSDMGFTIAARIAEVVMKKKFEMLAQQRLFRPIGMRQTSFTTLDGSPVNPSNGARTTAGDLLLFLRTLLNNGKINGQQILTEESVAQLRRLHGVNGAMKNVPKTASGFDYAMGAWAPEQKENSASVLVAMSMEGSVAVVDFCRNYAFVYLLKEGADDAKANAYAEIKGELDAVFTCKE